MRGRFENVAFMRKVVQEKRNTRTKLVNEGKRRFRSLTGREGIIFERSAGITCE